MNRGAARFLHMSTLVVGVSGFVYAWMRYVHVPSDGPDPLSEALGFDADDLEMSTVAGASHALEPWVQWLHVLSAPALVFAVGWIWQAHVWPRVVTRYRARRATGLAMTTTFVPMVVSGYAVQVSVAETWRAFWIAVHVVTSCVFVLGYVVHLASRRGQAVVEHSAATGSSRERRATSAGSGALAQD